MKKIASWLTLLLAALVLVACGNQSKTSTSSSEISSMPKISGFTYHGDIPKNPKKVVNFAYSYTGYLLELGVNVNSYSLDLEKIALSLGMTSKKLRLCSLLQTIPRLSLRKSLT